MRVARYAEAKSNLPQKAKSDSKVAFFVQKNQYIKPPSLQANIYKPLRASNFSRSILANNHSL